MTLQEWRTSKGWTQRDAAEALGMSRSRYRDLEAGEHSPTLDTVDALVTATEGAVTRLDWPRRVPHYRLVHEPDDMGYRPECCCFCLEPTRTWTHLHDRTLCQQVACCYDCACIFEAEVVPSKDEWRDWCRAQKT